jgi:Uma2 family endonuclease
LHGSLSCLDCNTTETKLGIMSVTPSSETEHREPTWDVAYLFPNQGEWSESDFFALHGNRLVELVDGRLEVLPLPTWLHQLIVKFLTQRIEMAANQFGVVLTAPLPVRLFAGTIREPDVMYFASGSEPRDPRGYPTRVDLAMEVVSEGVDAKRRDYEDKRRDYERAGVSEYWIVDPDDKLITVLVLDGSEYRVLGQFSSGQTASGVLLPELAVAVDDILKLSASGER